MILPTGFAMHQYKKEKIFREPIRPPEGYGILELDSAGQEFRWMAEASGDDVMKQLCMPGEDPHSYMSVQIKPAWTYPEFMRLNKEGDEEVQSIRKAGKVSNLCCALNTSILTNRGFVPIQDVKRFDLVWDGVEFVAHDGVVCSGIKQVVSYAGLTATPDHKVLVNGAWTELQQAAEHGWTIESALGARWQDRAWEGAASTSSTAPVYDIVNCGPRMRFAANGLIVHNSLQYRTSPGKLLSVARVDYGLDMTMPEAVHNHKVYPKTYKGVPKYWTSQIGLVQRTGYVETFGGRRVRVAGDWTSKFAWSMGSTAINFRIQGTGADQKYLAIAVLKPMIHAARARLALEFHDGLYFFVPLDKLRQVASSAKQALDNLPYKRAWDYEPSIPFPWDAAIGLNWGSMKRFEE